MSDISDKLSQYVASIEEIAKMFYEGKQLAKIRRGTKLILEAMKE